MGSPLRAGDGGGVGLTYLEELRLQRKLASKYESLLSGMGVKGFSPAAEEALGLAQASRDLDLLATVSWMIDKMKDLYLLPSALSPVSTHLPSLFRSQASGMRGSVAAHDFSERQAAPRARSAARNRPGTSTSLVRAPAAPSAAGDASRQYFVSVEAERRAASAAKARETQAIAIAARHQSKREKAEHEASGAARAKEAAEAAAQAAREELVRSEARVRSLTDDVAARDKRLHEQAEKFRAATEELSAALSTALADLSRAASAAAEERKQSAEKVASATEALSEASRVLDETMLAQRHWVRWLLPLSLHRRR